MASLARQDVDFVAVTTLQLSHFWRVTRPRVGLQLSQSAEIYGQPQAPGGTQVASSFRRRSTEIWSDHEEYSCARP